MLVEHPLNKHKWGLIFFILLEAVVTKFIEASKIIFLIKI